MVIEGITDHFSKVCLDHYEAKALVEVLRAAGPMEHSVAADAFKKHKVGATATDIEALIRSFTFMLGRWTDKLQKDNDEQEQPPQQEEPEPQVWKN